ncbi:hypothetical protein [Lacinutrix sp. 5H-3-7-4]|uniref:hypothetical protein n=1 Tax=Lacinutrix sp. (strain 5H-3-7-4) TaxID=983544 RepID=UPI00020A32F5|nr:hypothetical protein [Lacinutrix sp. 5H-3-7-4]AEH02553.1 hypothetical protein Lacal_2713 [Lacinutrix sp. 5H-3-7-4]
MKRIFKLILILLAPIFSYSQDWQYYVGNNAFDGEFKSASIQGLSDNYPYVNPLLNVNVWNEKTLNFHIKNSGFSQEGTMHSILFLPNIEPKVIYYVGNINISSDGKTIFLKSFKTDYVKNISLINFLEILKKASKIDVRVKTEFGNYDIHFNMDGYADALTKVLTKNFIRNSNLTNVDIQKNSDLILKNISDHISKENEGINKIKSLLLNIGVEENEISDAAKNLKIKLDEYNIEVNELSRIEPKINFLKNLNLVLYDSKNMKITSVLLDIPNFLNKLKKEKN